MNERIKELESEVRDLKEKLEIKSEDDQVCSFAFINVISYAKRKTFVRIQLK